MHCHRSLLSIVGVAVIHVVRRYAYCTIRTTQMDNRNKVKHKQRGAIDKEKTKQNESQGKICCIKNGEDSKTHFIIVTLKKFARTLYEARYSMAL